MNEMSFLELSQAARDDPAFLAQILDQGGESFLAANGFDLDGPLVAEALTNVAATLPAEEAEQLSVYTTTHSPVPLENDMDVDYSDPMIGIEILATTPASQPADIDDTIDTGPDVDGDFGSGGGPDADLDPSAGLVDAEISDDLDDESAIATDYVDDPFAGLDADVADDDVSGGDLADDLGLVTDEGDDIDGGFDA